MRLTKQIHTTVLATSAIWLLVSADVAFASDPQMANIPPEAWESDKGVSSAPGAALFGLRVHTGSEIDATPTRADSQKPDDHLDTRVASAAPIAGIHSRGILNQVTSRADTLVNSDNNNPMQNSRLRLQYGTTNSIRIFAPQEIRMGGFRMFGNYYRPRGRLVKTGIVGSDLLDNSGAGLHVESEPNALNWYAVFAGANAGQDTVTFTQMPFLRAHSVKGSVITLGTFNETDGDKTAPDTYAWQENSLSGADILIITEGGAWSGRTAKVVSNTAGSITVDAVGAITALDKFLISPPGFDEYVYCGSHLIDTVEGESRNRADDGVYVGMSGGSIIGLPTEGEIESYTRYSLAGLISPLSTYMKITLSYSASTASQGEILHEFSHDSSSHVIAQTHENKVLNTTQNFAQDVDIQFSINQEIYIKSTSSGGVGAAIINRQTRTRGYIEN